MTIVEFWYRYNSFLSALLTRVPETNYRRCVLSVPATRVRWSFWWQIMCSICSTMSTICWAREKVNALPCRRLQIVEKKELWRQPGKPLVRLDPEPNRSLKHG